MAVGWGAADGFQDQIEQTIKDLMNAARSGLNGRGQADCDDCDEPIPEARRRAYPAAIRCVRCQSIFEGSSIKRSTFAKPVL